MGLTRSKQFSTTNELGHGGLCPHPLRGAAPENPAKGDDPLWKPLLLPHLGDTYNTAKANEDLARLDLWRARSSNLYKPVPETYRRT